MGRSGGRVGASRNCLFLATGDDDLLTALGITALWRSGFVDPVVPPPRPAHIYAQQVIALVLQEGGLACGDADRWVGDALAEVPAMDRTAVVACVIVASYVGAAKEQGGYGAAGQNCRTSPPPRRESCILGRVCASPSDTRGRSRVPELGSLGSVRGGAGKRRPSPGTRVASL